MENYLTKRRKTGSLDIVAPNVARVLITMVNVYFIKLESENVDKWILVDAGIGNCSGKILEKAEIFMGSAKAPEAIVLTHGHFDHVGAIKTLAKTWNVPIYADIKEFPYLTGKSHYPPPDPTTGGGSMSLLSFMYPSSPINIGEYLKPFPENGILPEMPEWKVIKTPGHSPGHISLFRESDRTLIAGDAFVTVKQESAIAVMTQKKKLKGPPFYFTCDWVAAEDSVIKLRDLNPEVGATGHGVPMRGEELKQGLKDLTDNFEILGMPSSGRYVKEPAITNKQGVTYLPPAKIKNGTIATVIIGTFVSLTLFAFLNNNEDD